MSAVKIQSDKFISLFVAYIFATTKKKQHSNIVGNLLTWPYFNQQVSD